MSDLHSETIPMVCAHHDCTCEFPRGTGYREGERVFCNERCADPKMDGCGHDGCPCNEPRVRTFSPVRAS